MNEFIFPASEHREAVLAKMVRFAHQLDITKRWRWTVERYHATRTDAQNRALFGVAYPPIMDFAGLRGDQDKQDLHEYFCGEYWGWVKLDILGKPRLRPKRTTTTDEKGRRDVISKLEFMDFYAFIQTEMAKQGCVVPDPDPEWFRREP